jgi:hypothetical protein
LVEAWLAGGRFVDMAERSGRTVDEALGIHARALTYVLQTHVEQGIALLEKLLESQGVALAIAVKQFPNHLRFGVPVAGARILAEAGVRHRHACVTLGNAPGVVAACEDDPSTVCIAARATLLANTEEWQVVLGSLVFQRTLEDLTTGPDGL